MYILFVLIKYVYCISTKKMQIVNNNLANAEHVHSSPQNIADNKKTPITTEPITNTLNDKPEIIKADEAKNNNIEVNNIETGNNDTKNNIHKFIHDFFSQKLLKFTTAGSILVNLISAPIRLYDEDNPLKKIINHISMIATKAHQLTYSVSGLNNASQEKNPLLLFSFAIEGIAALFGIRGIYLFRGMASGIDGAVAGIQDRKKNLGQDMNHASYTESAKEYGSEIMKVTKEFFADPVATFSRTDGVHKGIISSWLMIFGSAIGLTASDSVGAGIRDSAGAVNDFSLIQYDSKTAKTSGALYLSGSIIDFAAHLFGMSKEYSSFRNVFHEVAIALDRGGQYLFMRYLEESKGKKTEKIEINESPKPDLHKALPINTQLAA